MPESSRRMAEYTGDQAPPRGTAGDRSAEDDLGVVARGLGDRAAEDPLGPGVGRAEPVALDQLLEHDGHLELGEGGAEAAAHTAAEGDPGVGAGRVVEKALGQEALRLR